MSRAPLIPLLAATFLFGCTHHAIHTTSAGSFPERNEVPVAGNFATTTQLKLQAAEHWQRVARDAAASLGKALAAGGACIPRTDCKTLQVRAAPASCDTNFNRVFYADFVTALVNQGYPITPTPAPGAIVVDIDVQALAFAQNRPQYRYAGEPVEIGPGLWALRDNASLADGQGIITRRTEQPDHNWFRTEFAGGPTPRNEIVVTVSAMSPANTYLARDTKAYYTADGDAAHYFCQVAPTRACSYTMQVTGDCTEPHCLEARDRRPR